jgi:hypothetical protein
MATGRNIALSLPRRLVCDLVHSAHTIPTVPVQCAMNVGPLAFARTQLNPRPSWCVIFTKAYAQVAAEFPELRRAYLSFPWARLYEHPTSTASVAVERIYEGEPSVLFAHIHNPEKLGLMEIERQLRRFKEDSVDTIPDFRSSLMMTRLPRPIRRLAWWYITHARGYRKATWLGTFGVSVYSALGVESLHPLSPLTTTLNYGVIHDNGDVTVRVIYDHRAMDGSTVGRALIRLGQVLNHDILAELRNLAVAEQPDKTAGPVTDTCAIQ